MNGIERYHFTCKFCGQEVSQQVEVIDGIPCAPEGFSRLLIDDHITYACDSCFAAFSQLFPLYEGGSYPLAGAELPSANKSLKTPEQECQEEIERYAKELGFEEGTPNYSEMVKVIHSHFFPEEDDIEKERKELSIDIVNLAEDNFLSASEKEEFDKRIAVADSLSAINEIWVEAKTKLNDKLKQKEAEAVCVQYSPMWSKTFFLFIKKLFKESGLEMKKPPVRFPVSGRNFKYAITNIEQIAQFVKNKEELAGLDFSRVWATGMAVQKGMYKPLNGFYGISELPFGMSAMGLRVYSNTAGRWVQTAWFSDFSNLFVRVLNEGTETDMINQLEKEVPIAEKVTLSFKKEASFFEIDGEKFVLKHFNNYLDATVIRDRLIDICNRQNINADDLLMPLVTRYYNSGKVYIFGEEKDIARILLGVVFKGDLVELKMVLPNKLWKKCNKLDTDGLSRFDLAGIDGLFEYNTIPIAGAFGVWLSNDNKYFVGKRKNIIDFLSYMFYTREPLQTGLRADSSAGKKLAERIPDMERRFEKVD